MLTKRRLALDQTIISTILLLATIVRLANITFPFGDYDEGVYLATVRSVVHGFPLISQTYNSQGPLFIYLSELFYRISPTLVSVRLFPVLCSLVIIVMTYLLVKRYFGRLLALFTSLYLAGDFSFLTVSRTFQVDMPWLAFSMASFFFLLRFDRFDRRLDVILSAIFFAMSISVKTNPLLIPVILTYFVIRSLAKGWRSLYNLGWYFLWPAVFLVVIIPPHQWTTFYFNAVAIRADHIGQAISWLSGNRRLLIGDEAPMLALSLFGGLIFLVKTILARRDLIRWLDQNIFITLGLAWTLVTVVAFTFYDPLFPHHFVFLILPAILVAAYGLTLLIDRWGIVVAVGGLLAILSYSMFGGNNVTKSFFNLKAGDYQDKLDTLATYIDANTQNNDYVITDDPLVLYLANRNTPPDLVDPSNVRIQSGLLTSNDLKGQIQKYQPAIIALISGRLATVPDFSQAIPAAYSMSKLISGVTVYRR